MPSSASEDLGYSCGSEEPAATPLPTPARRAWSASSFSPFVFGGVASCVAEACTFPIDTAKTRLQLQGQRLSPAAVTPYRGIADCWKRIATEEGPRVLYRGLEPALMRQAIYGTIKFGLYYTIKDIIPGDESSVKNVVCAVLAGSVSSALATPTDVLKVRLQSRSAAKVVKGSSLFECFRDIHEKEGFRGLWRGVAPTAQRAAVVAGVQLPVYDWAKIFLAQNGIFPNGTSNHLASSFLAGLCACLASSPVDVVRTRMMNQRRLRDDLWAERKRRKQKHATRRAVQIQTAAGDLLGGFADGSAPKAKVKSKIYKSSFECGYVTVRTEGLRALYKGFVPSFMRMGPWNIIFFLVYEKLKALTAEKN